LDFDYGSDRAKLREQYQQPDELPPELLAHVKKLDKKPVRGSSASTTKAAGTATV